MNRKITYEEACTILDEDIARRYFRRQSDIQQEASNKKHHWHVVNRLRFTVFLAAIILTFGMIGGVMIGSFDAEGSTKHSYQTITIQSGDTLWSIAEEYAPSDQDIRDYIYEVCDLNSIKAGDIVQGQDILIPVEG